MSDPITTAPAAPFKFSISAAVGDAESDALKVINKIHESILDPKSTAADIYAAVQTLESYVKSVYTLFTVHKAETAPASTPSVGTAIPSFVSPQTVLSPSQQVTAAAAIGAAQNAQTSQAAGAGIGSALLKDSGLAGLVGAAALAGGKLVGLSTVAKTDTLEVKQGIVSELETLIADAKAEYEKLKGEVESELGGNAVAPAPAAPVETPAPVTNG